MFANCQMGGQDMGFPDVCLTPSPVGPVPIPYPNIAMGEELQDLRQKVQDLINLPVNDKARNHLDRSPIAMLSRSPAKGAATLDIQVVPPGMFDTKNFGKDAACKSRISAQ